MIARKTTIPLEKILPTTKTVNKQTGAWFVSGKKESHTPFKIETDMTTLCVNHGAKLLFAFEDNDTVSFLIESQQESIDKITSAISTIKQWNKVAVQLLK